MTPPDSPGDRSSVRDVGRWEEKDGNTSSSWQWDRSDSLNDRSSARDVGRWEENDTNQSSSWQWDRSGQATWCRWTGCTNHRPLDPVTDRSAAYCSVECRDRDGFDSYPNKTAFAPAASSKSEDPPQDGVWGWLDEWTEPSELAQGTAWAN